MVIACRSTSSIGRSVGRQALILERYDGLQAPCFLYLGFFHAEFPLRPVDQHALAELSSIHKCAPGGPGPSGRTQPVDWKQVQANIETVFLHILCCSIGMRKDQPRHCASSWQVMQASCLARQWLYLDAGATPVHIRCLCSARLQRCCIKTVASISGAVHATMELTVFCVLHVTVHRLDQTCQNCALLSVAGVDMIS